MKWCLVNICPHHHSYRFFFPCDESFKVLSILPNRHCSVNTYSHRAVLYGPWIILSLFSFIRYLHKPGYREWRENGRPIWEFPKPGRTAGCVDGDERWCGQCWRWWTVMKGEAWKLSAANSMSTGWADDVSWESQWGSRVAGGSRLDNTLVTCGQWTLGSPDCHGNFLFRPCPTPLQWGSNQTGLPIRYGFWATVCCIESVDMATKDPLVPLNTGVFPWPECDLEHQTAGPGQGHSSER